MCTVHVRAYLFGSCGMCAISALALSLSLPAHTVCSVWFTITLCVMADMRGHDLIQWNAQSILLHWQRKTQTTTINTTTKSLIVKIARREHFGRYTVAN